MVKKYNPQNSIKSFISLCFIILLLNSTSFYANKDKDPKDKSKETSLKEGSSWLKNQPVEFLENKGQIMNTDNKPATNVLFKAEAPGIDLYITETGLSYVFLTYEEMEKSKSERRREKRAGVEEEEEMTVKYEKIDLDLTGATIDRNNIIREDTGIAYYNFMYGSADGKPIYHVKKYRRITIKNVYPGIDWVLYNSSASGFKYDFIVHPGADAKQIELVYRSNKKLNVDEKGNLLLESTQGNLEEKAPYTYYKENEKKVDSQFKLISQKKKLGLFESQIKIVCSEYDPSQTLVIDPVLVWSTFYGGNSYEGTLAMDTDAPGNVYLCGYSGSTNFPLLSIGTYFYSSLGGGFIVKFNNSGTLLWSTFFGVAGVPTYLATDNSNHIFICGYTSSTLLPTFNANTYFQASSGGGIDAYIAKFDNLGNCTWCTYYGGSSSDQSSCVVTDPNGNVFLLGSTLSTNFPIQSSLAYFESTMTGPSSGFIVKFDNSGNRLWATYVKGLTPTIGGFAMPIGTSDINGNLYLTGSTSLPIPTLNPGGTAFFQGTINGGSDPYLIKFDNTDHLVWGTYYGGTGYIEEGTSVATDKAGNVFFTGTTTSTDFPVQSAGTYYQPTLAGTLADAYILKFDNTMTRKWATYFGGSREERHWEYDNLSIDSCGNLYFGVTTKSRNLPFQPACEGGMHDNTLDTSVNVNWTTVYLARFSNSGNLLWSSYYGGDGNSFRTTLDADRFGNLFFSGEWNSVINPSSYPLAYPPSPTYTQTYMGGEELYMAKLTNANLAAQHFSYTNLCVSDSSQIPTLASGFLSGGTFSASPGLSINPITGQITSSASTAGNYTVNYSMAPCYCPGAVASVIGTTTVSLLTVPTLSIAGKTTMCLKESRTFTVSGGTTYTWNTGSHSTTISANPTTTTSIVYTVSSKSSNGCVAKKVLTITVSKCTGIEDFEMGAVKLNIYPNPNSGQFTISSDRDIELEITNELGQLVQGVQLSDKNERKVEVQGLANGIYFIKDKHSKEKTNYKIVVTN